MKLRQLIKKTLFYFFLAGIFATTFCPSILADISDQNGQNQAAAVARIELTPNSAVSVRSSEKIWFSAVAFDGDDNPVPDAVFSWALVTPSSNIGFFTDSVFTATKVGSGRIKVTAETITVESGLITVTPGDLDRIFLDFHPEQLARKKVVSSAEAILYDSHNNLVSNYSLSANPLEIVSINSSLSPTMINDNSRQVGGVVKMLPVPLTHSGETMIDDIYVASSGVNSQNISVAFNGYDILDLVDSTGFTVSQLNALATDSLHLTVVNNGRTLPNQTVSVKLRLMSGTSDVTASFTGSANGTKDSIVIPFSLTLPVPNEDDLRVIVATQFNIGGVNYAFADTAFYNVSIFQPIKLTVADGSFKPDTVYPGEPFNFEFDLTTDEFSDSLDSTWLLIEFPNFGSPLTLFNGMVDGTLNGSVIEYKNISASFPTGIAPPAYYPLTVDFIVYSGDDIYIPEIEQPDSIYLLPEVQISYSANSLAPAKLQAGAQETLGFGLEVISEVPLKLYPIKSSVSLSGIQFNIASSLDAGETVLQPGENMVTSQPLFIPMSQLGNFLTPGAVIKYSVFSDQPTFDFIPDFNGQTLEVTAAPSARIISFTAIAPNAPHVNSLQAFTLSCRVANSGSIDIDSLSLLVTSDGSSAFVPSATVFDLEVGDTAVVIFDVTASASPTDGEVFRVDIQSGQVIAALPLDNTAAVQIDLPATLTIAHQLLGIKQAAVEHGQEFSLLIEINNDGQAGVGPGKYRLTSENIDFGLGDTATGSFTVGRSFTLNFHAPYFDTVVTFLFEVTEIPIDKNNTLPAILEPDFFEFTVRVESIEADLLVEPSIIGSNLVLPGRPVKLFEFKLSNLGLSPNSRVRLDQMKIIFTDREGRLVSASKVLLAGNTGFCENNIPISVTNPGGGEAYFIFDDFIIEPGSSRTITFEAEFKEYGRIPLKLRLPESGVIVRFEPEDDSGKRPHVLSSVYGDNLVSLELVLKHEDFEESFVIKDNPFNPEHSPAVMTYELVEDSEVEFRVFTLIGETVYTHTFPAGSDGGSRGENFIEWDGRNSDGEMVLNGVYIASISMLKSGETATRKIALVK